MLKNFKRFSLFACFVLFVLAFSGCGNKEAAKVTPPSSQPQKQTPTKQTEQGKENETKNNQGASSATNEDALLSEEQSNIEADVSNQEVDDLANSYDENEL